MEIYPHISIVDVCDEYVVNDVLSYTDCRTISLLSHTNKHFEIFYVPCKLSLLDKYSLDEILSYTNNKSRSALRTINTRFKDLHDLLDEFLYSFSLRPDQHQPTGSVNFSRMDNATLRLTLFDPAMNHNAPRLNFNHPPEELLYNITHPSHVSH
jgi:hypothetical protein